jgi:hypothetical protein
MLVGMEGGDVAIALARSRAARRQGCCWLAVGHSWVGARIGAYYRSRCLGVWRDDVGNRSESQQLLTATFGIGPNSR